MSTSTAELTLIINARNLAGGAMAELNTQLGRVKTKAGEIVGAFKKAFAGLGSVLGMAVGNLAYDLEHGQGWDEAFRQFGLTMAVLTAMTFAENVGGQIAAKVAAAPIIAAIGAQLTVLGTAIGGVIDAGIAIGMAALPFVLIAAIIAAIALLIFDEDIRNKVFAFVGQVITNIGTFLGAVGATMLEKISAGIQWVADHIGPFAGGLVKAILDALASIPGKIADLIRSGLMKILPIDIGPLHISMSGVTLDLPKLEVSSQGDIVQRVRQHRQGGGWVGLHGPELSWVGEHGPEYVHPSHGGGSGPAAGVTIVGVTEEQITDMIERKLYFRLRRAAPTLSRT